MSLEYLVREPVLELLFALKWSDKFERDLIGRLQDFVDNPEASFRAIKSRLVELQLANEYKGGAGSPYLALTDRGQAIADRLYEIQFVLNHPEERKFPDE